MLHLSGAAAGIEGTPPAGKSQELSRRIAAETARLKDNDTAWADARAHGRSAIGYEIKHRAILSGLNGLKAGSDDGDPFPLTGWKRFDQGVQKMRENREFALFKIESNAYKFAWALIPLSVPFVALLFWRRRDLRFYDHAIFVTYSIDFMMLLAAAVLALTAIGLPIWLTQTLPLGIAIAHIYVQVRDAYTLSIWSASRRTLLLLGFALVVLGTFALLLLGSEVIG